MEICCVCGQRKGDGHVCANCGFDESKDYSRFLTLTKLADDELICDAYKYEEKKNSQAWLVGLEETAGRIHALDSQDSADILRKIKKYYEVLLEEQRSKYLSQRQVAASKKEDTYWSNLQMDSQYKMNVEETQQAYVTVNEKKEPYWSNLHIGDQYRMKVNNDKDDDTVDVSQLFSNISLK